MVMVEHCSQYPASVEDLKHKAAQVTPLARAALGLGAAATPVPASATRFSFITLPSFGHLSRINTNA